MGLQGERLHHQAGRSGCAEGKDQKGTGLSSARLCAAKNLMEVAAMRLFLPLIFVFLCSPCFAQNTLVNRPGTVDDLVILDGAQNLLRGGRAENVRPSADGKSI